MSPAPSMFVASIPSTRIDDDSVTGARHPRSPVRRSDGAPARILLAEDDGEMRALLASALRSDGYDVVEAADGGRLLVQIADGYVRGEAREAYDLVITDIRMPVCSGLDIVEELRRASWTAPIILMTAFGDVPTQRRAKSLDATLFDKPFDIDDLRTAVLNLLAIEARARSEAGRASPRGRSR